MFTILSDQLGVPPGADLLDLATAARGDPFELVDLVEGLREDGLVERHPEGARLVRVALPRRCQARLLRTLGAVSTGTRQLVQVASLAGPSVPLQHLVHLLRSTAAGLLPHVEEALATGLLVDDGADLAFAHDLVRRLVADSLPRSVREVLAAEAGAAMETGSAANGTTAHGTRATGSAFTGRAFTGPTFTGPAFMGAVFNGPIGTATRTRTWTGTGIGTGTVSRPTDPWAALTVAEFRVACLAAEALTNKQIARRLGVSQHTVNSHLRQIFKKLDLHSRVQLALIAQAHPVRLPGHRAPGGRPGLPAVS